MEQENILMEDIGYQINLSLRCYNTLFMFLLKKDSVTLAIRNSKADEPFVTSPHAKCGAEAVHVNVPVLSQLLNKFRCKR